MNILELLKLINEKFPIKEPPNDYPRHGIVITHDNKFLLIIATPGSTGHSSFQLETEDYNKDTKVLFDEIIGLIDQGNK